MKITALNQLPVESVSHNPAIKKQVMLRMGDLPHLTNFSQARFQPGQVADAHMHTDMHEVFFVESGEGAIALRTGEANATGTVIYPLTPGTCIAVAPYESHKVTNTGTEELVLTYFGLIA